LQFGFRPFMRTAAMRDGLASPSSNEWFVNVVFHELTHTFISKTATAPEGYVMPSDSQLSARYCTETHDTNGMAHLHLHAILQQVYANLRSDAIRNEVERIYQLGAAAGSTDYFDSWQRVKKDGPALYISDLKHVFDQQDAGIKPLPSLG